jgi:hypothetical protein
MYINKYNYCPTENAIIIHGDGYHTQLLGYM